MEKRLPSRHIRSLVNSIELEHLQRVVIPAWDNVTPTKVDARINGWRQPWLFHLDKYDVNRQQIELGYFYELVTAGLYGGVIGNKFAVGELRSTTFDDDTLAEPIIAYPDVQHPDQKIFSEAKACHPGERLALKDGQISLYKRLLDRHPDHQLRFVVYRHPIDKIASYTGESDELFQRLAAGTFCSLVLPFSVIESFHASRDKDLVYRYDGDLFEQGTAVKSPVLNTFFEGSRTRSAASLLERLGLDPAHYRIERKTSPLRFEVQGYRVKPFPILSIEEPATAVSNHSDYIPF